MKNSRSVEWNCRYCGVTMDTSEPPVIPLCPACIDTHREHKLGCRAYSNYQPPYEDCTCGAEEPGYGHGV